MYSKKRRENLMHSVVTILLSGGQFIMWLFCLPLFWLLNATDYCVQGLFRHIPQGLFGKLIPQQQSTIQIKAHASEDSHVSGPKLQVIAEQTSKKPPVVDYYERVRPDTSNRKKNRKAAMPNKLDQGAPIQQHTKQKDVDKAAGKRQQGTATTLRLISYAGYRWFVSWLALSQPSIRMNRRIPVWGKEAFMRKPLAVSDTPEASVRVGKMVDEPFVAISQSAPVQQKPAGAGAVFSTSWWLARAAQVYAQHAPVEAGRQASHKWQLTTEGVDWYCWADAKEWQKAYCVEAYLQKILQYDGQQAHAFAVSYSRWGSVCTPSRGYEALVEAVNQRAEKRRSLPSRWITQACGDTLTVLSGSKVEYRAVLEGQRAVEHTMVVWMAANRCIQYATISKGCVDKAALLASFATRQWGEANADTRWVFSKKDKYFQGVVVGVVRAYAYTRSTARYQYVSAEKVATLEVFNKCRQHKALTDSAHSASEVSYEALRLPGQTQKESMAICAEPQLEKGSLLEGSKTLDQRDTLWPRSMAGKRLKMEIDGSFDDSRMVPFQAMPLLIRSGKNQGLAEAKKLRQVTAVSSFIQQDVGGWAPMLSRAVQGWWAGNLICNQVDMEQFDGRADEEHFLVPEYGHQGNKHDRWVLLKLISFGEIQTAATKMQKAVRKWLTSKSQPLFYQQLRQQGEGLNTQEVACSDWFDPLEEGGWITKIEKWQRKAKISSPQLSTMHNKQDGRGGEKENIPPLPQAQLHRGGKVYPVVENNDPFVTPVKLRAYVERARQEDWTPIYKLTEYSDLLSSEQRKRQGGSPEGEILLEAEKRLEEAVELLASLEHSPDQDVQAVIEKITRDQEDILERMERMERVRHADRGNGTAFCPTEKGGAATDKRALKTKQASSEQNAVCPAESVHTREKVRDETRGKGRKLADNGYESTKEAGSLRSVSEEQGLFTVSQKISPQIRRSQTVESKLENYGKRTYGAVYKRQAKKAARLEGQGSGKNRVSAWKLGRAYSESLLDRRVSPDSTNIKSLSLTAPRPKSTTP